MFQQFFVSYFQASLSKQTVIFNDFNRNHELNLLRLYFLRKIIFSSLQDGSNYFKGCDQLLVFSVWKANLSVPHLLKNPFFDIFRNPQNDRLFNDYL